MKIGQRFNPFGMFHGAFIPNVILKSKTLSSTEKLVWARLGQYAGQDGNCYPSQETLSAEVGLSISVIQGALRQLEKEGFILRITPTGKDRLLHKNNSYVFLWHESFDESTSCPEPLNSKGRGQADSKSKDISNKDISNKDKLSKDNYARTTRKRTSSQSIPYQEIQASWNEICSPKLSSVIKLPPKRQAEIRSRCNDLPSIEKWEELFQLVAESDFLNGDNDRGWQCSFDWLIENDTNFVKVLEGRYKNKTKSKKTGPAAPEPGKYGEGREVIF